MSQSVKIQLTYTPDDSTRVAKLLRNESFIYRNDAWLTAVFVFVAFIVIILFISDDVSSVGLLGAIVFSAIPAVMAGIAVLVLHKALNPWLMRRTINKYFESSPTAGEETSITFSAAGIETKTDLTSSFTKWPAITKVTEYESDILFYSGRSLLISVPNNSAMTLEQTRLLKAMLVKESLRKVDL